MGRFRTEVIGDATLILGDCREVFETLASVDHVITDPPFEEEAHTLQRRALGRGAAAGSGSTGVACLSTGRRFIGVEAKQEYFDHACERLERAYRQPRLFEELPPKPVQGSLLAAE